MCLIVKVILLFQCNTFKIIKNLICGPDFLNQVLNIFLQKIKFWIYWLLTVSHTKGRIIYCWYIVLELCKQTIKLVTKYRQCIFKVVRDPGRWPGVVVCVCPMSVASVQMSTLIAAVCIWLLMAPGVISQLHVRQYKSCLFPLTSKK